jgi:hypothetical protein
MFGRLPFPALLRFGNEVFKLVSACTALFLLFHAGAVGQNCTVNAGIPLQVCANAPMTLYGQASGLFLGFGNITWTQVAGPAVLIVSPNSLTTSVTGYASGNHYTFKLNAFCSDNSLVWDTVTYYVKSITFANAGTNQQVCGGAGALSANPPSTGETGHWQLAGPGNGITVTSPSSPASQIIVDPAYSGNTTLQWIITNANGCLSTDDVIITNLGGISPVDAGPDQVLGNCYTVNTWTTLAASFGGAGSGQTGTVLWKYPPEQHQHPRPHRRHLHITLDRCRAMCQWIRPGQHFRSACRTGHYRGHDAESIFLRRSHNIYPFRE